jgi:hypothetical protein
MAPDDRLAVRIFSRLLWLLPGPFRRPYSAPMRQTFADLCADTARTRGTWALLRVFGATFADLVGAAVREWVATLVDRQVWHRTVAGGVAVLGVTLVVYSQVRWPANLVRIDYVLQYLLVVTVLLGLAGRFSQLTAPTVLVGLAGMPGWLVGLTGNPLAQRVGLGYVAVLVVVAAILDRHRHRWAGLKAGAFAGVLGFVVTVGYGTVGPVDPEYRSEYLHRGQSSLSAYAIGERIDGAALLLVCCATVGFLASAAIRCTAVTWRRR